jgi:hypothetical protein
MSKGNALMSVLAILLYVFALNSCGVATTLPTTTTQTITLNSEPTGAKVIANGAVICASTPCNVTIPLNGKTEFTFIKNGYVTGKEILKPAQQWINNNKLQYVYSDAIFHLFEKQTYVEDPTIRAGEAANMVTRDQPGGTALERTIIRWNFDSEPRGSRIFWRVISSIPDQVKNTNETYLTTTPYEETRSFNILGLTYENSRDITVEIKVTKTGYYDQVKRYNVRQAIDQQEISGFFELVKTDK